MIKDLGSQNGTWIGRERLPPNEAQALEEGAVLGFGVPPVSAAALMEQLATKHVRRSSKRGIGFRKGLDVILFTYVTALQKECTQAYVVSKKEATSGAVHPAQTRIQSRIC